MSAKIVVLLSLFGTNAVIAVPPNTSFTNTATVDYQVNGNPYSSSASETLVTDAGAGNSAPHGVTITPAVVDENADGAVVGDFSVSDLDPADTHTISVDDVRFELVGLQLKLLAGQALDFETEPTVLLNVTVTDSAGGVFVTQVLVSVNDLNEAPTAIGLDDTNVTANSLGAIVGQVTVADPDTNDTHTYAVDDARFEVVNSELKLVDGTALTLGETVDLTITVTDSGGLTYQQIFSVVATPPGGGSGTTAGISAYQYAPGVSSAQSLSVEPTQCDAGAGFQPLQDPTSAFGQTIGMPGTHEFLPAGELKSGEPLFIQVLDADANADSAVIEFVDVVLASAVGDNETIRIYESGPSTGVFYGWVSTLQAAPVSGNCLLQTGTGDTVTLTYTDVDDVLDVASTSVLVDPFGILFDSATGTPINGAVVTIIDEATGTPAVVFADDGVSPYPDTVTSGDAALGFTPGNYRFPFVAPGGYRLVVTPPNRFAFPSSVSDADLQLLPGAPYALGAGARGSVFTLPVGPAVRVDLPLDLQPVTPSVSSIDLFVASASGNTTNVGATECFDGASFNATTSAATLAVGQVPVPGTVTLESATRFTRGDTIFVRLEDRDQDLDAFGPDTVEVSITTPAGDTETLRLTETNDSTGIFSGFIQTSTQEVTAPNNCSIEAAAGATATISYVDAQDGGDTASIGALLDPGFTVISSLDGEPLDGATVTLIDVATGAPATDVFSYDGTTSFPATVVSGGSVVDGNGAQFQFALGSFFFPVVGAGDYRLDVTAPTSYVFPSSASDAQLNQLPNGPFNLQAGSRGETFTVIGGVPVSFDLPLDPVDVDVFVTKEASKEVVAVGDFLQYRITVENGNPVETISSPAIVDTLPIGFRIVRDSVRIDGQRLPPSAVQVAANGQNLTLPISDLAPLATSEIRYVVEVTAGAKDGLARNEATLTGIGVGSANLAFADVLVQDELFSDTTFIVGQVTEGDCDAQDRKGVPGVRIWLEDGTFVVTDTEGKYHFEAVRPGTHVVQLDTATLPLSHAAQTCQQDTRFAGSAISQFVDLQPGAMWRADFSVAKKAAREAKLTSRLDGDADPETRTIKYTYRIQSDQSSGGVPLGGLRATIMLGDGTQYVAGSARLNGAKKADPQGVEMGALTFPLPDTNDTFSYELSFRVDVDDASEVIEAKALLSFKSEAGKHRTEVATNDLGLNWPSSLSTVAESHNDFSSAPRRSTMSRANLDALRSAKDLNASKLGAGFETGDDAPSVQVRGGVHEPSLGENASRSNVVRTPVTVDTKTEHFKPYVLPEQDRGKPPVFDQVWLEANKEQTGIVWPPERYNPVMPAIPVAVLHASDLRPQLLVDGELVNALTFEGTTKHHKLNLTVSKWDGVPISETDTIVEVQLLNSAGDVVSKEQMDVHYSGAAARAELVPEASYLIADGLYAPVVAVRLFDRAGFPLRAGTTGEFTVVPPYAPLNKTKHLENLSNEFDNQRYRVLRDGIAYIQLEPTAQTGQVELNFHFDNVRQETVRARMLPGQREWIMVGLLEGSFSKNSLSGNLVGLDAAGLQDETLTDGRVAFYAKGMVKGDWLLTAAYDTDKEVERTLRQQIDPNQFYTLYGDGTNQLYDAESQRKLYLKVEKSRFTALFGDFDTEFQRSELARYERRMNGLNVGYYGEHIEMRAFASETDQGFVRDEIQGDGTSGVYRLSRTQLVRNSELVRLVTRDRFSPDEVLATTTLTRYQDYSIDFDRGTLIFKQPIFSQDEQFNPIFIEVEYETAGIGANDEVVAGTRMAYRLDDRESEVAMTYINDDTIGQGGELLGADVTWQFTERQKLTVEYAETDTDVSDSGDAYLVELEHKGENLAGRAYVQEQDLAFGLGHQATFEKGIRKIGVEGEYRIEDDLLVSAQAFEQSLLEQDTQRLVMNAQAEYKRWETQWRGGLRTVQEETSAGDLDATQVLLGATRSVLSDKLILRSEAELDVSSGTDNTDYPSRAILGAEYKLLNSVSLIGERELSWSDTRKTQDTRVGVRARPWSGGDVHSLLERRQGENAERLFATTGLLQQWRLNEAWLVDAGFDRVHTIKEDALADDPEALLYNPFNPPVSGSINNDFSAAYVGLGYQADAWNVSSRLEFHEGDQADKWNFLVGANRQLAEGRVVSASVSALNEDLTEGGVNDIVDLRFGLAWRPDQAAWNFLNRTDLIFEERQNATFDTRTRKWVNNTHANFKPNWRHQLSLNFGMKYVVDTIDDDEYDGITLLYGSEYRYNVTHRWDVGVQAIIKQSLEANIRDYAYGASVGYNIFENAWVSVGYNERGFEDDDFVAAEYTAQGPYLKLRLKLDQEIAKRFLAFAGLERSQRSTHANGR